MSRCPTLPTMDAEDDARGFCPFEGSDSDAMYQYKLRGGDDGGGDEDEDQWEAEGEGSVSFYQGFAGGGDGDDDDDDDDDDEDDGGKRSGLLAPPQDEGYSQPAPMALADLMLRNLGKEYNATIVQGGVLPKPLPPPEKAVTPPQQLDDDGFGDFLPPVPPADSSASSSSSFSVSSALPSFATATFDPFPNAPSPPSRKPVPEIDVSAVKRAVLAIRHSAPSLAASLDRGAGVLPGGSSLPPPPLSSLDLADDEQFERALQAVRASSGGREPMQGGGTKAVAARHAVIPPAPLQAFVDCTAASAKSSRNLSRSATICNALHLFGVLDVLPGRKDWNSAFFPSGVDPAKEPEKASLVLHVVGSDSVECDTLSAAAEHFSPVVRWLSSYLCRVVAGHSAPPIVLVPTIDIVLIGPGVPSKLSGQRHVLPPHPSLPGSRGGSVSCVTSLYHDYLSSPALSSSSWPQLAVAFNAGVWGYDDWTPTVQHLVLGGGAGGGAGKGLHFVVTSYTKEEGADDQEAIEAVLKDAMKNGKKTRAACIWGSEENEFGSRLVRETKGAVEGRVYRENASWQGWRFEIL